MSEDIEIGNKAVIYTDGGYRASVGIGGWGLHGFTYTEEESKRGTGCKSAVLTSRGYQPKDYKLNPKEPKITVKSYLNGFGALRENATNNVAEIVGLKKALEWTVDKPVNEVLLKLDSQYVLEGFSKNLDQWANNGWIKSDGQRIANQEHWQQLKTLKDNIADKNIQLNFQWVKGHAGHFGNEQADQHATRAMTSAAYGADGQYWKESDAQGYWKPKGERSRLISHPQWYFASIGDPVTTRPDGSTVYYLGFSGKKAKADMSPVNYFGKETSETKMTVLYLKEADQVLEQMRQDVIGMSAGRFRGLVVADLQALDKKRYDEILEFGTSTLIRDYAKMRLLYDRDTMACEEITPARLAYKAIDTFNLLEEILQLFIDNRKTGRIGNVIATDITNILYEEKKGKKTSEYLLRKNISTSTRCLDVECAYATSSSDAPKTATVRFNVGQDLPDRNTLSAIAGEETKVWAITWPESKGAFRYASIVETTEGIGLWAGPYSNLHLLKP